MLSVEAPTTDVADASGELRPATASLWSPRFILYSTFLLGFPGGFGLVARNTWRLGRKSHAKLILLIGAAVAAIYFFIIPDDLPRPVLLALNAGAAGGLYQYALGQEQAAASGGIQVLAAPKRSGIATILGGWLICAGPSILLAMILAYGGAANPALAGTVVFGSSGSDCDVKPATSLASGDRMYWVAYLSREAHDGEVLRISERAPGLPDTPQELVVDGSATCVANDGYVFALPTDTITVEVTVGSERLALGRVSVVSR